MRFGKSALIVGYGREGQSAHRYFVRHHPELEITVADKRLVELIPESKPSTPVLSGEEYLSTLHGFDTIVVSPGIKLSTAECEAKLTSATRIFFERCPGMIVGVTGTKGKSTTSSLIAAILGKKYSDVRLAGNIGIPMLDQLEEATEDTVFVLELSSFQLRTLHKSPHIAVLLNIVPEHLDYHGSFEDYSAAKSNLFRFQGKGDLLVVNRDFASLEAATRLALGQRICFSRSSQAGAVCFVKDGLMMAVEEGKAVEVMPCASIPLLGEGNLENALAAATVGVVLGVTPHDIAAAISAFKSLEHRLEFVGEFSGISFFNDSLSTIPEALVHAVRALGDDVSTLIAGGHDRGLDYSIVGPAVLRSKIENVILFPETGEKIWNSIEAAGGAEVRKRFDVHSMEEAVRVSYELTPRGKICLLSPASASFNLFADYRERGEKFKEWVRKLSEV